MPEKAASGGRLSSLSPKKRRDLSRGKLISAAIRLLNEKGLEALTIRGLAEAVGATPMALYNHFDDKQDLLFSVADSIISHAVFDGQHADWRRQVHHCFTVLRDLCLHHPGLPGLLALDGSVPSAAFAPMKVTLSALKATGMNEVEGARTFFLLTGYTLSQAAYQTAPVAGLDLFRRKEQDIAERVASDAVAGGDQHAAWDFDASFNFGLSLILAGIESKMNEVNR